jgi:hypothetical protein
VLSISYQKTVYKVANTATIISIPMVKLGAILNIDPFFYQEINYWQLGKGSSDQKSIVGCLDFSHLSRNQLSAAWISVIRPEINCRLLGFQSSDQKSIVSCLDFSHLTRNQSSAAWISVI